jgi:hypothetical protein
VKGTSTTPPPAPHGEGEKGERGCFLCSLEDLLSKNLGTLKLTFVSQTPAIKKFFKYFARHFFLITLLNVSRTFVQNKKVPLVLALRTRVKKQRFHVAASSGVIKYCRH